MLHFYNRYEADPISRIELLSRIFNSFKGAPPSAFAKMTVQFEDSGVISYSIPVFSAISGVENILRNQLLSREVLWFWCNHTEKMTAGNSESIRRYSLQRYSVISLENINTVMQDIMTGGNMSYGEDFTIFGLSPSSHSVWKNEKWLEDNLRSIPLGMGSVWIIINQLSDVSSQQIFVTPDPALPVHAMLQSWMALVGEECVETPYDPRSGWSYEKGFLS